MTLWLRFEHDGRERFGTLKSDTITVHEGDMFGAARATSERVALGAVRLLTPCRPGKMVALWNNYHALAQKMGFATPAHPLYFFKADTSFAAGGETVRRPRSYDGKVVYEGELGLVIGRTCRNESPEQAASALFGCTCINDVTAIAWLNADPAFAQWTRAKGPDTFGVFGPVIATGVDAGALRVRTRLDGVQRQDYPISDMVFTPVELVSHVSRAMTLQAGDVIACGTSLGVGSMKPGVTVEVEIEGVGTLANTFQ